jgi:hypothetical protein
MCHKKRQSPGRSQEPDVDRPPGLGREVSPIYRSPDRRTAGHDQRDGGYVAGLNRAFVAQLYHTFVICANKYSVKTEKPLLNSDQSPRRMRIPRGVTTVTVPVNLFKSKFVKTRSNRSTMAPIPSSSGRKSRTPACVPGG